MFAEEFYKVRESNRIKPEDGPTIMVLATRDGHFRHLRPAYDALTGQRFGPFEIPVKLFSSNWMEPANEEARKGIEQYKIQKVKDQKAQLLADLAAKKKALEEEESSLKAIIGEDAAPAAEEVSPDADTTVKRGPGRPKKV